MTYVKTYLPTLKMHVVNLKRDAKDLSRDLQRLEVRGKLGSKTLYHWNRTEITVLARVCVCVWKKFFSDVVLMPAQELSNVL